MATVFPTIFKCESNTGCEHIVPDDVFVRLRKWASERDNSGDLYICHDECVEDYVTLKHEDVWNVVCPDPEN